MRSTTLALMLLACTTPCLADTAAFTQFSDLRISLVDITPDDSIAPSISFAQSTGSFVNTYTYSADPYSSLLDNFYTGNGAVIAGLPQSSQASAVGAVSGATVTLSGSTLGSGAIVTATTFAKGSPGQYSESLSNAYLGDSGFTEFTLGVGTSLRITGSFDLSATSNSHDRDEFAQADALLLLQSLDGQEVVVTADIYAGESNGIPNASLSQSFAMTFNGSADSETAGEFFGRAYAYASTYQASAVAEPPEVMLLFFGLFALATARASHRTRMSPRSSTDPEKKMSPI